MPSDAVFLSRFVGLAMTVFLLGCEQAGTTDFSAVAKTASPSVVNVAVPAPGPSAISSGPNTGKLHSLGSGFVIKEGYVLTNLHVVAGQDHLVVVFDDSTSIPARLVRSEESADLAILELAEFPDVRALRLSRERPIAGEWVIAIGNPFGLTRTVSVGVVSAADRVLGDGPLSHMLQTDASINPGNSGGPLLNADGEVIGMSVAIVGRVGGSQGIGFAVPSEQLRAFLDE